MHTRIYPELAPAVYAVLRVRLVAAQSFDMIPTQVYIEFICVEDDGTETSLGGTRKMHTNINLCDAVFRQLRVAARIFAAISKPTSHIQIELGNISAFLLFTKQLTPITHFQWLAIKVQRMQWLKLKLPTIVKLVDMSEYLDEFELVRLLDTRTVSPSLEQLGITRERFYNDQAAKRKI